MKIRLSLCDHAFAHSPVSNGPVPPVIAGPQVIEWDRQAPYTEKTIFTDSQIVRAVDGSTLWLIEPVGPQTVEWLIINAASFRAIWTHERQLLEAFPNARFVPLAGCWIAPGERQLWGKSKDVSIVASNKRGGEGYDLRHAVIAKLKREIDAFGAEYTKLQNKVDSLRDYRFQVVVENARRDFWYTEKLIDCFVTGTVPIYWGCPAIGNLFNAAGIVAVNGLAQIIAAVDFCTPEFYRDAAGAIRDNFERAKRHTLAEDWITEQHPEYLADLAL